MINKKSVLAILLIASMVLFTFAGCTSSEANSVANKPVSVANSATSTTAEASVAAGLGTVYDTMNTEKVFVTLSDIPEISSAEPVKIGLAMGYGVSTPFYKSLADAFMAEAEALGAEVFLADCESDAQTQVTKLENFIAQGVNGIVILPADPNTATTMVQEKAFEDGIPFMTVDVPAADGSKYMASFITDAYQLGYAVGEQIAKDLLEQNPEGDIKYGLIGGVEGNPVPTARNTGMRDAIQAIDTEGRIVEATFLYANAFTEESGLKTAENMLIAHPDLKAILGTCDAHVVGATAAAKRQGLDKGIIMGGVDGSKAAMEIMRDGGPIKVLALNSPIDVGRAAARSMMGYIAEGAVPVSKAMIIKGDTVTPENVDSYIANAF